MTKRKLTLRIALSGYFGYFVGSSFYQLLGVSNVILRIISIIAGAGIVGFLNYFYLKNKYPEIINESKMIQDDERGRSISEKAASYTLNFIFFIALIGFLVIFSLGPKKIYYILGIIFSIVFIFYLLVWTYLDNKN